MSPFFALGTLLYGVHAAAAWRTCDVTSSEFGARGDGVSHDTAGIRRALEECDHVILPRGRTFLLQGPLNLTSNQVFQVDGTLIASNNKLDYPVVQPIRGYGWSEDTNCFPPGEEPHKIIVGALRYAPIIGAYDETNVTVMGSGVIDGNGEEWWSNCSKCHYTPGNDSSLCLTAGRPKLLEFQYVDGLRVYGSSPATPLHLKDSPFWTLTPSYCENIHIHDLNITAPMDRIGNTDGVNIDSSRNVVVENIWIKNSDDGVCIKAGLFGFGMNLAIPTENVLVRNITCAAGGRGGFALGSELSGGMRNITFKDSTLLGERGIHIKAALARGGYIVNVTFENVYAKPDMYLKVGPNGEPLEPGNHYLPVVSGLHFVNVSTHGHCNFDDCSKVNGSKCYDLTFEDTEKCGPYQHIPYRRMKFTCKAIPPPQRWKVCIPTPDYAPVNNDPDYPNWGPTTGLYDSYAECRKECV